MIGAALFPPAAITPPGPALSFREVSAQVIIEVGPVCRQKSQQHLGKRISTCCREHQERVFPAEGVFYVTCFLPESFLCCGPFGASSPSVLQGKPQQTPCPGCHRDSQLAKITLSCHRCCHDLRSVTKTKHPMPCHTPALAFPSPPPRGFPPPPPSPASLQVRDGTEEMPTGF